MVKIVILVISGGKFDLNLVCLTVKFMSRGLNLGFE